jgi:hypothetical protein
MIGYVRFGSRVDGALLWCAFSRLIIAKEKGASLAKDLAHSRPHKSFDKAPVQPFGAFLGTVEKVLKNCLTSADRNRGPKAKLGWGDARSTKLPKESVDLILTSPPYLNAIDYLRCSKFSSVWMGHNRDELRRIRSESVGAEVGVYRPDQGGFAEQLIKDLRLSSRLSSRHKAVLLRFVEDMRSTLREARRVLVRGGRAVIVVGENAVRGVYIRNAKIITAIAEDVGLVLEDQCSRTLPPNRRYLPPPRNNKSGKGIARRMRREVILSFRKSRSRAVCRSL